MKDDFLLPSPACSAVVGDRLPELSVPLSTSFIVVSAIASRDFQPVHHDAEIARARGSKDVFMNILTTQGLVARFVTDWAGPSVVLRKNAIKLGAPNYPGDTIVLGGTIADRRVVAAGAELDVSIIGKNRLGEHVSGIVTVFVPESIMEAGE